MTVSLQTCRKTSSLKSFCNILKGTTDGCSLLFAAAAPYIMYFTGRRGRRPLQFCILREIAAGNKGPLAERGLDFCKAKRLGDLCRFAAYRPLGDYPSVTATPCHLPLGKGGFCPRNNKESFAFCGRLPRLLTQAHNDIEKNFQFLILNFQLKKGVLLHAFFSILPASGGM